MKTCSGTGRMFWFDCCVDDKNSTKQSLAKPSTIHILIPIPMYFSIIAKTIRCCDKLCFLGVSIVTRRDLQRSIIIHLNLAILQELVVHSTNVLMYGLSMNDQKKRQFSEAHSFHNSENYKY